MINPVMPQAPIGAEVAPLNSLALVSAFLGEYLNTMTDRPATRECVRMQVEDALRRLEAALQPKPEESGPPQEKQQEG